MADAHQVRAHGQVAQLGPLGGGSQPGQGADHPVDVLALLRTASRTTSAAEVRRGTALPPSTGAAPKALKPWATPVQTDHGSARDPPCYDPPS